MFESDLVIKSDKVWDGESQTFKEATLVINKGIIERIEDLYAPVKGKRVIDACGLIVSPGFIDIHAHVEEDPSDTLTIQKLLLLQGVTTAISGNCGSGLLLDDVEGSLRERFINLCFLTPHAALRRAVGIADVYERATPLKIKAMRELLRSELEKGAFGLSFGLEYTPNVSQDEIYGLAQVLKGFDRRFISIHIRHDGPKCIDALKEAIALAEDLRLRVEISHLGSMTAFGYAKEALNIIEDAVLRGVDVKFDSYPYSAFCTHIGSAVFDPGFEERWGKGLDFIEVASGKFKGMRLNEDLFNLLRKEAPETLVVAHVMNEEEMRLCLSHPMCAVASDGVIKGGWGHPRAAGAFPRGLLWLREAGYPWEEALKHVVTIPRENAFLEGRGELKEGSFADVVIFDPLRLSDRATFSNPTLPPDGIRYVIVNGEISVEDGKIIGPSVGFILRR